MQKNKCAGWSGGIKWIRITESRKINSVGNLIYWELRKLPNSIFRTKKLQDGEGLWKLYLRRWIECVYLHIPWVKHEYFKCHIIDPHYSNVVYTLSLNQLAAWSHTILVAPSNYLQTYALCLSKGKRSWHDIIVAVVSSMTHSRRNGLDRPVDFVQTAVIKKK